jgi:hypothetical protein
MFVYQNPNFGTSRIPRMMEILSHQSKESPPEESTVVQ